MESRTHLKISARLCGEPVAIGAGSASCRLETTDEMAVDDKGLVHGGFVFGLADYAAMLAVNDPNVVLGSAETRFLEPVRRGDRLIATAQAVSSSQRKREVRVEASVGSVKVFEGIFTCFVLEQHVLAEVGSKG